MTFLVDNQLPRTLARWLKDHGDSARHILDDRFAKAWPVLRAAFEDGQRMVKLR